MTLYIVPICSTCFVWLTSCDNTPALGHFFVPLRKKQIKWYHLCFTALQMGVVLLLFQAFHGLFPTQICGIH